MQAVIQVPEEALTQVPTVRFLPAFLISHKNRFRRADFYDSFPPGEALAASPLYYGNCNLFSKYKIPVPK